MQTGNAAQLWSALTRCPEEYVPELQRRLLAEVEGVEPLRAPPGGRVVVAGDWHGNARHAAKVVKEAGVAGIPLVLQAGDFGFWPGGGGREYLDVLEAACARAGVFVAWVDGNHEWFEKLLLYPIAPNGLRPVRPHVWHTPRGHRWAWDDVQWIGVGGAVSVDRALRTENVDWWAAEELTVEEVASVKSAGRADVMLCHDRPSMVTLALGERLGEWHESAPGMWAEADLQRSDRHQLRLQEAVDAVQPSRLFHGHLHWRSDVAVDPAPWGGRCMVHALGTDGTNGNALTVDLRGVPCV